MLLTETQAGKVAESVSMEISPKTKQLQFEPPPLLPGAHTKNPPQRHLHFHLDGGPMHGQEGNQPKALTIEGPMKKTHSGQPFSCKRVALNSLHRNGWSWRALC